MSNLNVSPFIGHLDFIAVRWRRTSYTSISGPGTYVWYNINYTISYCCKCFDTREHSTLRLHLIALYQKHTLRSGGRKIHTDAKLRKNKKKCESFRFENKQRKKNKNWNYENLYFISCKLQWFLFFY